MDTKKANVVDIIEMIESTRRAYGPSTDGFVFSELQIDAARRARNREHLAGEAYEHRLESAAG